MRRVTLKDQSGRSVEATVLREWTRDQARETAAPTFVNMAAALFAAVPPATRVMLLRAGGVLLFLVGTATVWLDVRGELAEVKECRG